MYGWGHEFGPEILMDRDIIWVTINYRLNVFGKNREKRLILNTIPMVQSMCDSYCVDTSLRFLRYSR